MENSKLVGIFTSKAHTEDQLLRMSLFEEQYDITKRFFGGLTRPIGLEFEIENARPRILVHLEKTNATYWHAEQDGSLRNEGIELISKPLAGYNIDYALFEMERILDGAHAASSVRTSIHVHVDVSDLGVQELFNLVALYALFEKPFFSLQSYHRQNNPFCYEITDLLPTNVSINERMKYCALNLAPIETQMSIEFRHGDFSTDMRKNRRWIQVVCKFVNFAGRHKHRLREIINNAILHDDYIKLFSTIMGKSIALFDLTKVEKEMKENALWAATFLEHV